MTDQIKTCEICSKSFFFYEEEHLLAKDDPIGKGHFTALFPNICQRCNTILIHLDACCAYQDAYKELDTYQDEYKELLDGFDQFSNSLDEFTSFIAFAERNF